MPPPRRPARCGSPAATVPGPRPVHLPPGCLCCPDCCELHTSRRTCRDRGCTPCLTAPTTPAPTPEEQQ